MTREASRGQHWAIFCGAGFDTRNSTLDYETASTILDLLSTGEADKITTAIVGLEAHGGVKKREPKATAKKKPRTNGGGAVGKAAQYQALYDQANEAGRAGAAACTPEPMIVAQHSNMLDDSSPVTKQWYVPSGVCGFGWVKLRPATSGFARWLKKKGLGTHDDYAGGLYVWVDGPKTGNDYGQSYDKKMAHATAMAKVLQDAGLNAYADGRLD